MNKRELKRRLKDHSDRTIDAYTMPAQIEKTAALCIAVMRRQADAPAGPRQSFWGFLSDVFHFEGLSILLSQLAVFLAAGMTAFSSLYDLPMFMPLFILAVMPAFFKGQRYRVSELEAGTRTSGALLTLARLVLAGGGALVCLTFLLALEVWLQRSFENLGQMVIYCLVPYLTCMTAMLALLRRSRTSAAPQCMAISLGSVLFWRGTAIFLPWLYEASALGLWIAAVLVYSCLLAKEITYIIHANKEVNMYGIVA